jgi:hypothetical protein
MDENCVMPLTCLLLGGYIQAISKTWNHHFHNGQECFYMQIIFKKKKNTRNLV